jgi:hypothetical protein
MFTTKCIIRFATHQAHITVDEAGTIQVFKYSQHTSDFDVFKDDQYEAGEYILTPPQSLGYRVIVPGDHP